MAALDDDARPAVSFDGGALDCGNGLLLLLRKHIGPLRPGELLELWSREASVREDLPAWCRLTGNDLASATPAGERWRYLIVKGRRAAETPISLSDKSDSANSSGAQSGPREPMPLVQEIVPPKFAASLPPPAPAPTIPPLSAMGVGSWPRPAWLLRAKHELLEGRLDESEYQEAADDAVRLAVAAQERAGVDVVTDGEQRREDYAGFVGRLLDNCQLIPVTDLLPYIDHPDEFAEQLRRLDVPADRVRHPAVFGRLGRGRPLAVGELEFAQQISSRPVKVALPGPYLLTRTMWMECISDRAYPDREELAADIVRVLREELHFLLAAGAALVQFDEPVLTEVVHGRRESGGRTFMCGALGGRSDTAEELALAERLVNAVTAGAPRERVALHVCRGNWTPDERAALAGGYEPLVDLFSRLDVGGLFLELCTKRAGEMRSLAKLPERLRIGVGVVDQKSPRIESPEEIIERAERAIALFGPDRVLLNPDCGFATFADNPITAASTAEAKLHSLAEASRRLRAKHRRSP